MGLALIFGAILLFVSAASASAYEVSDLKLKIYDSDLQLKNQFNVLPKDFQGETDFTLGDIDGDEQKEIIVSFSDQKNDSKVVIYENNGDYIREFYPYVKGFKGMIYLAVADLDNDRRDEIITGAGFGGGPQVRVFNEEGIPRFVNHFWADDQEKYRNGVRVAAGDVNNDGLSEIITTTYNDKLTVGFYNRFGQKVKESMEFDNGNFFEPGEVMAVDLGNDGINELIVNYGFGNSPELRVLRNDGSELNKFMAYHPGFGGGVDLSGTMKNDQKIFVTGAGFTGGPHVRFLNQNGEPVKNLTFFVYPKDYKGGVSVSAADIDNDNQAEYVVAPKIIMDPKSVRWPKHIEVDIAKQQLHAYQYGKLIKTFYVSTGTWKFPTPLGSYKVFLKRRSVHMRGYYGPGHPENYDLPGVPYVLSFNGPYTIHGTYWHSNFGYRMSHGCVNMYTPHSKWVYEWAPMGTPVFVYNGNREAVMGIEKPAEEEEE